MHYQISIPLIEKPPGFKSADVHSFDVGTGELQLRLRFNAGATHTDFTKAATQILFGRTLVVINGDGYLAIPPNQDQIDLRAPFEIIARCI